LGFIGQAHEIFPSDLPLENYITTFLFLNAQKKKKKLKKTEINPS